MKIIRTTTRPKKSRAMIVVKDSEHTRVEDILAWARDNLRGNLWWSQTQFRDPRTGRSVYNYRQRHFKDGYWVYNFYFALKGDAAKFLLIWGLFLHE